MTRDRVAQHFAGMITGRCRPIRVPNLGALNFLLHGALDGGGTLSLKTDAQGKVVSTALSATRARRAERMLDTPQAARPPTVSAVMTRESSWHSCGARRLRLRDPL